MKIVTRKDVQRLARDPLTFAMMMNDCELESVVVTFVSVLNKRQRNRGG
jgi:hypothetical protein